MKISYIVNTRMPNQRAHGFQIAKTCEKLAALGNEVELWYPYRKNDVPEDIFEYYGVVKNFTVREISGIDVIFLDAWIGAYAFSLQGLLFSLSLMWRGPSRESVVYTRDIFIAALFHAKKFSVVYNVHNWSKKRALFSTLFLSKKMKVVCNSLGTREILSQNGFVNILVAHNGVEVEQFALTEDKKTLREKCGLPQDKAIALYAGGLYPWKGIDTLIECARIKPEVLFVVVGGDENDLSIYGAKALGIPNITFVGHRQKSTIPWYMCSADVLLLPTSTRSEEAVNYTSPIKLFEYMATGVPIVASDLPSTREIVQREGALLVEPDNPESLARGIETVLRDQALGRRLATSAFQKVQRYTWDAYASKIVDFLKS